MVVCSRIASLAGLSDRDRQVMQERASHVREALTGFHSGGPELAQADEPRPQYDPALPLVTRYRAKAHELGVSVRRRRGRSACWM